MFGSVNSFLSGGTNILWFMIALPVVFGILTWVSGKSTIFRQSFTVLATVVNLLFAISLYVSDGFTAKFPFAGEGLDIAIKVGKLPALFLVLVAALFFIIGIYSAAFLKDQAKAGLFQFYLFLALAMVNGTLLSDNLGIMLFFSEGLLCPLFGMLLINHKERPKAAVKALVLSGTADLLLMLGIALTSHVAGTPYLSEIQKLPVTGIGAIGFACMMLGAVGLAGGFPFHSWIPEAAEDAPVPFTAAFPGTLGRFVGVYFAVRIVTDIYDLKVGTAMSVAVMVLGVLTLISAAAMALVQTDLKRLIAYLAVGQVGYILLGIGSGLPGGVVGGLSQMLNSTLAIGGLFMAAGAIERQAGTTDLREGGLLKKMPVTGICFAIFGLSVVGFPPLGGFFSTALLLDAAQKSSVLFLIGALIGLFLTAVALFKAGRTAFSGESEKKNKIEAGAGLLVPMGIAAVFCVLLGIFNAWATDHLFGSALGYTEAFGGWPKSVLAVVLIVAVLLLALGDHLYGFKKTKSAANSTDHIRNAPVLKGLYNAAEKQRFDPYRWLMHTVDGFSWLCAQIERAVSWFYDVGLVKTAEGTGNVLHRVTTGSLARYLFLAIAGVVGITVIFLVILL